MTSNITLSVEVDAGRAVERLDRIRATRLPQWRRQLAESISREVLRRTIAHNPVDTGRSRSAWVTGLARLGGAAPPGWKGPHPDQTALSEGAELVAVSQRESATQSEVRVSNGVDYVSFLEFGTQRTAPSEMVSRSLSGARELIGHETPSLFE